MATAFEQEDGATTLVSMDAATAMGAHERANIDMQIATAKAYPRNVAAAVKEAREFALVDEDTAASMFYALPRDGKTIEGPSVRLAEIMLYCWGNLRADYGIESTDKTTVTSVATVFDLEKNLAVRGRVDRRITTKGGKRYGDDMIVVTGNAGASIALRNAAFRVIPAAHWKPILQAARIKAVGSVESISKTFKTACEWFAKFAITEDRVLGVLGCEAVKDVTMDDIIKLRGLRTALMDSEITLDEAFPLPGQEKNGNGSAADRMNAGLEDEAPKPQYLTTPEVKKLHSLHAKFVSLLESDFDGVSHTARGLWMLKLTGKDTTALFNAGDYGIVLDAIEAGRGPKDE